MSSQAHAISNGIVNFSGKDGRDCNFCHRGTNYQSILTFDGDLVVAPGSLNDIRLTLMSQFGGFRDGGINIALSDNGGRLIPGESMEVIEDELTHSSPAPRIDDQIDWHFQFEAPNRETRVILYACREW